VPTTRCGTQPARWVDDEVPSVLVGLSTTYQHQEGLLQAVLDALGSLEVSAVASTSGQVDPDGLRCPPNVVLRDHVDHRALLADTDCMVTHAGLGSVAAALSQGVPLVCVPLGRDQHLNARRTAHLGAGIDLGAGAAPDSQPDADTIAAAVHAVLTDRSYREGARRVADANRASGGPTAAVVDLESLLTTTPR
jgi:MGT family glycosyltransferase